MVKKEKPKIIVVVGPTASGKTSLSIELANKFSGEIISADSRQIYRGLDIGTSKITPQETRGITHHLLDVADPQDTYTVADFVRDGRHAIEDIVARGKLPIIVGGTFFYVDALLGRVVAPEVLPNEELRAELEEKSIEELFTLLQSKDPRRAENIDLHNRRRLIRALEIAETLGEVPEHRAEELYDVLMLGIDIQKDELRQNIHERLRKRLELGMVDEVTSLLEKGLSPERLGELGIEYRYICMYLQNEIGYEEMQKHIETKSWQYAKRQMTWLKRDQTILWVKKDGIEEINMRVKEFLR